MDLSDYIGSSIPASTSTSSADSHSSGSSLGEQAINLGDMSNNPFALLRDDDSTVASRRSSASERWSGADGLKNIDYEALEEKVEDKEVAKDCFIDDIALNISMATSITSASTPTALPPPPPVKAEEEDNSLISSVVTAHLKQRSCAVVPLVEATESAPTVDEAAEDENVYMMLFSPGVRP